MKGKICTNYGLYIELTDPDYQFKKEGRFQVSGMNFKEFKREDWTKDDSKIAKKHWKAHFSVDKNQLADAWALVYPLLEQHAASFKVVDLEQINSSKPRFEKRKLEASEQYHNFITQFKPEDKHRYEELLTYSGKSKDHYDDYDKLFAFVEENHKRAIDDFDKMIKEAERVEQGMQITLYMTPDTEKEYQKLFEQIEEVLAVNGIAPGVIHASDRALGIYTSIRHPGKNDYHDGIDVASYNPDNVTDPFNAIDTKKRLELLRMSLTYLQTKLQQKINYLKNLETSSEMDKDEQHNIAIKKQLGETLDKKAQEFFLKPLLEQRSGFANFEKACTEAIYRADKQIKNEQEWKPLVANIVLLLSGVGTVLALISLGHRVVTGRYGFFDNKEEEVFTPLAAFAGTTNRSADQTDAAKAPGSVVAMA